MVSKTGLLPEIPVFIIGIWFLREPEKILIRIADRAALFWERGSDKVRFTPEDVRPGYIRPGPSPQSPTGYQTWKERGICQDSSIAHPH
jgi:hypothetical protein